MAKTTKRTRQKTFYLDVSFGAGQHGDGVLIRGWEEGWSSRKMFIRDLLQMCEEVGEPMITEGDSMETDHVEIEIAGF